MGDSNLSKVFCCTCLVVSPTKEKLTGLNFIPSKDISYKFKLKSCVPEMVLDNSEDCFLCKPCLTSLETAYSFRCMCLRNEGKLAEYRQNFKKSLEPTNCFKTIIKQEIIEPMCCDDFLEDVDVFLTESRKQTVPNLKTKIRVKTEPDIDPFEGLENGVKDQIVHTTIEAQSSVNSILNKVTSEVEIIRVDNGKIVPPKLNPTHTDQAIVQQLEPAAQLNEINVAKQQHLEPTTQLNEINLAKQQHLEPATQHNEIVSKPLTDIEIIENACQIIPELLAYNCDAASLRCWVALEHVQVPSDMAVDWPVPTVNVPVATVNDGNVSTMTPRLPMTANMSGIMVKLPPRQYVKKKYIKKGVKKYNKNKKKDINYWCHICLKYIAIGRRHRYNAHMLNHKNIKAYKCDKCTKRFTYGETLSKHKKECNGILPPIRPPIQIFPKIQIKTESTLNIIQKPFANLDVKHIKPEPIDEDNDNDWADEMKGHKYMFNNLNISASERKSMRAKTISKQLYSMNADVYQCEICEYQSYKKHQYQVHMMKHFNDRRFECTACPKKFFENWELNRHLRTVHLTNMISKRPPPNSYSIDNLEPLVPRQTNISEHTDDTNDSDGTIFARMLEPSVSLTVNNETVVTPIIQSIESLAHNDLGGAVSFACKICNLSFRSHNLLTLHTQTHKYQHHCNVCGQSFISNSEYVEHIKMCKSDYDVIELVETHVPPKLPPKKKKKKKFFCTICNLEFASKDHANIHTGAKPYDCKVCGKEFAAYSTLRKHRWTHSDEPRSAGTDFDEAETPQRIKYNCDICNKVFINKWQVYSHTCHSATGEAVYRCQICKNAFVGRTALIEHMGVHVNQSGDFYQ